MRASDTDAGWMGLSPFSDKPLPWLLRERTGGETRYPAFGRDAGGVSLMHGSEGAAGRQRVLPLSDEFPLLLRRNRAGSLPKHPALGSDTGSVVPMRAFGQRIPPLSDEMAPSRGEVRSGIA